ncbi:MAG TPA: tripartite tricarboxylate transporter permease [Alphaproteobacteria bacterium]
MEMFANLALGFAAALTPTNLLFCLVGALIGTLVGVLPGIGPAGTIALLLPITYYMSPLTALIMLAGIYYGAQYGGSTTAILIRLPGESSSVVTTLDGHAMARKGRAGAALAIAALASFFAGTVATVLLAVASPPLSALALRFSAPEYFALMVFGLIGAVVLAQGSLIKAVAMVLLGLLMGLTGTDLNSGQQRFTFGIAELADGINFVTLAIGVFGITEILINLEHQATRKLDAIIGRLWPTREEARAAAPAALRGTAIGAVLGVLPGGGALLSAFAAYTIEKKLARDPSRFGNGAVEGLASPEAANNAGAQTSFIPLLTLGIPFNPVMALMIGAMTVFGITPGPGVITNQPELFWGVVASMWIGNLMLVIINLPLIGMWVQLLKVPYRLLAPSILLVCSIGVYSLNNSPFEVGLAALFGLMGYAFHKFGCEPAPLLLGFILGPLMEENLRRALVLSRGDPMIFLERPISLSLLILSAALLVVVLMPAIGRAREAAFREE